MKLIPMVVLLAEEHLPALHAGVDRYREQCPADVYERMTALKVANGWTDDAIVAGILLGQELSEESP